MAKENIFNSPRILFFGRRSFCNVSKISDEQSSPPSSDDSWPFHLKKTLHSSPDCSQGGLDFLSPSLVISGSGSWPSRLPQKTTGYPSSKWKHWRTSALSRNIDFEIQGLLGGKTYRFLNLRKWKDFNKKQLTLHRMCVTSAPGLVTILEGHRLVHLSLFRKKKPAVFLPSSGRRGEPKIGQGKGRNRAHD